MPLKTCPSLVHHPGWKKQTKLLFSSTTSIIQHKNEDFFCYCCCSKSAILIPHLCCKNGLACLWGRGCTIAHTGEENRKYFTLAWKGWGFLCFFLYLSRKSWQSSHINEQHHQSLHWQWAEKRGICQTDDILLFSVRAWLFIARFCWQKAYCIGMGLQRRLCHKSA